MADLQIVVRDTDTALLNEIAEREWRTPNQQASALIESALNQARARANAPERSRSSAGLRRVTAPRVNGAAAAHSA